MRGGHKSRARYGKIQLSWGFGTGGLKSTGIEGEIAVNEDIESIVECNVIVLKCECVLCVVVIVM